MSRGVNGGALRVRANGMTFECRTWGDAGPLALLLHGFPDDPGCWSAVAAGLAEGGLRVVAPYLRGYGPSRAPADCDFGFLTLADDVIGLVDALGADRALIVGHDWGAICAWLAATRAPERVAAVVGMSVPPLRAMLRAAPTRQLIRSRYMGAFQLPGIAERSLLTGGIERLWRRWSPDLEPPPAHLAAVRATLAAPGSLSAALGYYRSLMQDAVRRPRRWRAGMQLALRPIPGRAVVVHGARDRCIGPDVFARLDGCFATPPTVRCLDAGHFLPIEAPTETLAILRATAHDAFVTER